MTMCPIPRINQVSRAAAIGFASGFEIFAMI
jgi:hypothetical protein